MSNTTGSPDSVFALEQVDADDAAHDLGAAPTIPELVTPETPLDSLNLNWRERELPESQRTKHVHRLHPYLGKFIPQLVEIFLRKYMRPGQTVLDPFCGSGTTLVQASELGINAIGYDVSAFNVLLARAKTRQYQVAQARREVLDALEQTRVRTQADEAQPSLFAAPRAEPECDDEYLRRWFAPAALRELLTYRSVIFEGSYAYRDLLSVILSRSARSARLTTHFDLDFPKQPQYEPYYCYKHKRQCSPTTAAFGFLRRYSQDTLERIEAFARLRSNAAVTVCHDDVGAVELPQVDGVITSPPYVGLIDYHEQHAYAYHLLGLPDHRQDEIGAAAGGSSLRAQARYQEQIATVFRRAAEVMPAGARMIVVANDTAGLYPRIAELAGVEVEHILRRHVNRRTGRRAGNFYESVLVWRKAGGLPRPRVDRIGPLC